MESKYEKYILSIKKFCQKRGIELNLNAPKTIQDKLNWLNIYEYSQLKTDCTDRLNVHKYVTEKIGEDICTPVIKSYNSPIEIRWSELPDKFVLRCNHGSGMEMIVKNKSALDKEKTYKKLCSWLDIYYTDVNNHEFCYQDINPKVMVDEFMGDNIRTYRFWCFNGNPAFMSVQVGKNGPINHYGMDKKFLSEISMKNNPCTVKDDNDIPVNFDTMVAYSKKLCSEFKFVCIDFYEIGDKVYMDKMCFTPYANCWEYADKEIGVKVGNMLKIGVEKTLIEGKKCIYTCITGGYEGLGRPSRVSPNFDYICFTDADIKSDFWKIRPLPKETEGLSTVKKQRYVKINAHKVLPEYDFSIWIDGNVDIRGDIDEFIAENCQRERGVISIGRHPERDCVYDEGKQCAIYKKDTLSNIVEQLKKYEEEGMPRHYGLVQTCILFRYHNDPDCIKFMEDWWHELYTNKSHRDQLSISYVIWKNNGIKFNYLDKTIFKCEYFLWGKSHNK